MDQPANVKGQSTSSSVSDLKLKFAEQLARLDEETDLALEKIIQEQRKKKPLE